MWENAFFQRLKNMPLKYKFILFFIVSISSVFPPLAIVFLYDFVKNYDKPNYWKKSKKSSDYNGVHGAGINYGNHDVSGTSPTSFYR